MLLLKLLIIFKIKLFFSKLISDQTLKGTNEINENKDFLLFKENLESFNIQNNDLRLLKDCQIVNCQDCKNNTCLECSKGFIKKGNHCFENFKINKNVLLAIIFGSASFILMFCIICVYFANKNRHKYVKNPALNKRPGTKCNSIVSDLEISRPTEPDNSRAINVISRNLAENSVDEEVISDQMADNSIEKVNKSRKSQELKCPVCLLDNSDNEVEMKILNCGHKVHLECNKLMINLSEKNCKICLKQNKN